MNIDTILEAVPLFGQCMDATQRHMLSQNARAVEFAQGEEILKEGEQGDKLYVIKSGTVSVITKDNNSETKVAKLRSGQIFGEISLLTGLPRLATIIADDTVELIEITKPMMRDLLRASPKLYDRFASLLQKRQGDLDQIVSDPGFWQRFGHSGENLSSTMRRNFEAG
jgi:CRP-like cAMP-binding protein